MCVLIIIESNAGDSVFQPLIQGSNRCITNVFGMLLKYQSHVFWDTRQLMGPWQSHTGRMELKDRCEGKLIGRPETTSSLVRTYGTNTHPRWVKMSTGSERHLTLFHVGKHVMT